MSDTTAPAAAPLDEVMLAMDVVDTLRHRQDLVDRALDEGAREQQLIDKLREIYHQQGIEVTDAVLKEGVAALNESRFVYTPPAPGWRTQLARLYVTRGGWGRWAFALVLALVIGLGGYFLAYRPYKAAQAEQARQELAEGLPRQMDGLYQSIFDETKVQQAANEADELRNRGKQAAGEGNRAAAEDAIARLTKLRDTIRQDYTLKVVNRQGTQSGFWTFPEINTEATNYYLVVEALDPDGKALSLPILNEENGETETVNIWGVRVPETVYNSVVADKQDDGIIEHNVVGIKQYGFLDVDYVIPVLGGAVTRW
ncbi:MAG TPA: DUF6384 family protein [Devosiaceae bacterium]|jgi:hypothetical protein